MSPCWSSRVAAREMSTHRFNLAKIFKGLKEFQVKESLTSLISSLLGCEEKAGNFSLYIEVAGLHF